MLQVMENEHLFLPIMETMAIDLRRRTDQDLHTGQNPRKGRRKPHGLFPSVRRGPATDQLHPDHDQEAAGYEGRALVPAHHAHGDHRPASKC